MALNLYSSNLSIYYQNVQGLRTKTEQLYDKALIYEYDIIAFTESWLNSTVYDHELLDHRYNIFRRDRSTVPLARHKKDGGGVFIAIRKKYEVVRKTAWESKCEDLWVTLRLDKANTLNICVAYLPSPATFEYTEFLMNNITNVIQNKIKKQSHTLILGDFNMPKITWSYDITTQQLMSNTSGDNNIENLFLDSIAFNNLYQHNSFPNSNQRILDLILSSRSNIGLTCKCSHPLVSENEHHPALVVDMSLSSGRQIKPIRTEYPNYILSDYDAINNELKGIDWSSKWSSKLSVNEMLDIFYKNITPILERHTPKRKPKDFKYPVWFSYPLIKLLKEKARYHAKYKKYNNLRDKITFETLRDRCGEMIKQCFQNFKNNIMLHLQNNPKFVWKFIHDLKSNSATLPYEMSLDGKTVTGGQAICDLFSDHFQSIYSNTSDSNIDTIMHEEEFQTYSGSHSLGACRIQECEVLRQLSTLDISKGPGPDGIPPIVLKKCAENLHRPLTTIFNKSLESGTFPDQWKLAHITPIPKTNDLNDIAKYRPISNLSTCCKIFESIMQTILYSHVKAKLNPEQHGFLPKRSTVTNLVAYVSDITDALDRNKEVHAIYTDFSKAFDLVRHDRLLLKLKHMGIHGSLLRWCESYLRNRSQLVSIFGYKSAQRKTLSGVPQGSHLGPLLFIIFINDLCMELSCKFKLYADDVKVYNTVENQSDIVKLQNDIDTIQHWCSKNQMVLNLNKCYHIKFTRKTNPIQATYNIDGKTLTEVTTICDLGVVFDSKMSFRFHFESITKKASQLAGFITRQLKLFRKAQLTITIYNSIIRSILEYCSPVWNPVYEVHSNRLERIQKRFLYHVAYNDNKCRVLDSYSSRLQYYRMTPLHTRRKAADVVFLYKIVSGLIDCPELLNRLKFSVPRASSRLHNRHTFKLPQSKTNLGQHSPIYRMCNSYNKIDHDYDLFFGSLTLSKRSILRCLSKSL